MKNVLIIISGMPATGKTRFAEWLSTEICIPLLSLDEVWENSGGSDIPFAQYWTLCESKIKSSSSLIVEFGFNNGIKPIIDGLVKKFNYQTINVHFDTAFEIAHYRFNDRRLYDMGGVKPRITLEQYIDIAAQSKNFYFGDSIIYVDTTDFSIVSYEDLAKQIQQYSIQTI